MSSKAGSVSVRVPGRRRGGRRFGGVVAGRAYQMMISVCTSRAKGTVRSTASRTAVAGLAGAQDVAGVGECLLDGLITNGKFCCVRRVRLSLTWWRRPLRLRAICSPEPMLPW